VFLQVRSLDVSLFYLIFRMRHNRRSH